MERKADTIKIKGGIEYAKVASRLLLFHSDNAKCSVKTDVEFHGDRQVWALVRAVVSCDRGKFTGHSMAPVTNEQKLIEKLETVATGRALAFAGYMASGEIASFEEMAEYQESTRPLKTAFQAAFERDIDAAQTIDRLEELREKLNSMVEDQTINPYEGHMIIQKIFAARQELEESNETA